MGQEAKVEEKEKNRNLYRIVLSKGLLLQYNEKPVEYIY